MQWGGATLCVGIKLSCLYTRRLKPQTVACFSSGPKRGGGVGGGERMLSFDHVALRLKFHWAITNGAMPSHKSCLSRLHDIAEGQTRCTLSGGNVQGCKVISFPSQRLPGLSFFNLAFDWKMGCASLSLLLTVSLLMFSINAEAIAASPQHCGDHLGFAL
jgi:hypothetical protein